MRIDCEPTKVHCNCIELLWFQSKWLNSLPISIDFNIDGFRVPCLNRIRRIIHRIDCEPVKVHCNSVSNTMYSIQTWLNEFHWIVVIFHTGPCKTHGDSNVSNRWRIYGYGWIETGNLNQMSELSIELLRQLHPLEKKKFWPINLTWADWDLLWFGGD